MTASFSRCNPRTVNAQTRYQTERIFLIARVLYVFSFSSSIEYLKDELYVRVIPIEKLKVHADSCMMSRTCDYMFINST